MLTIWAPFVRNFVTKNFHKSPNLVTLVERDRGGIVLQPQRVFRSLVDDTHNGLTGGLNGLGSEDKEML